MYSPLQKNLLTEGVHSRKTELERVSTHAGDPHSNTALVKSYDYDTSEHPSELGAFAKLGLKLQAQGLIKIELEYKLIWTDNIKTIRSRAGSVVAAIQVTSLQLLLLFLLDLFNELLGGRVGGSISAISQRFKCSHTLRIESSSKLRGRFKKKIEN